MKKLLLSLFTSLTALSLYAQQQDYRIELRDQLVNSILQKQAAATRVAAKTTGTKERLIGTKSYYRVSGGPFTSYDSTILEYTGTNGSKYDFNKMTYNIFSLPDQSEFPTLYTHTASPNNIADIMFDSVQDYNLSGGAISMHTRYYRRYSGNLATKSGYVYYDTISNYNIYTYNAKGDVTSVVFVGSTPSKYDTSYIRYFTYDASGKLTEDSMVQKTAGIYKPYFRLNYTYDGSGRIAQGFVYYMSATLGTLRLWSKYTMNYDASSRIATLQTDTGTTSVPYDRITYGYTPGINYYTLNADSMWTGSNWVSSTTTTKYINASGLPDSMVSVYAIGSENKHVYTYDATGNVNADTSYSIATGSSSVNYQQYFYEPYTDAVHDVQLPMLTAQLYPNPVNDVMRISIQNMQGNNPAQLSIYNEQGQIVKRAILNTMSGQAVMHIEDLASGIYFVNIQVNGYSVNTEKLIKQ